MNRMVTSFVRCEINRKSITIAIIYLFEKKVNFNLNKISFYFNNIRYVSDSNLR